MIADDERHLYGHASAEVPERLGGQARRCGQLGDLRLTPFSCSTCDRIAVIEVNSCEGGDIADENVCGHHLPREFAFHVLQVAIPLVDRGV